MRYILIISLIFGFSLPTMAQDAADFKAMSVVELQDVDTTGLSKKQKKAHKKELKKKQKTEKKRLKKEATAAKKAAKKQAKAEKKAVKAQAKFDKKVAKTYKNTRAYKDDFEAYSTVRGPNHDLYTFWENNVYSPALWYLNTFVYPDGRMETRLYLSLTWEGRLRNRGGKGFKDFANAVLIGGYHSDVRREERVDGHCGYKDSICLTEVVSMGIPEAFLLNSYNAGGTMDVRIEGRNRERVVVKVSKTYLKGYVTKAQTLGLFNGGQSADSGGK
jgi:hypothetical protein